jgi:hypothetical protein
MIQTFIRLSSNADDHIISFEDVSGEILDCERRPLKDFKYIEMARAVDDFEHDLHKAGVL